MTNFEKIILTAVGVLVVIVLVVVAVVFRQQKAINALTGSATGTSSQATAQIATKKNSPPLSDVIKNFSGKIESISGNQITVSTSINDFSKPKNSDASKDTNSQANVTEDNFETISKRITVSTNGKTVFEKKPLANLKVGDNVSISSDKSPYTADTVTAEKVTYNGTPK